MQLHHSLTRAAVVAGLLLAVTATPTGAQQDPEDPGSSTTTAETTTTTAAPEEGAGRQPPPTGGPAGTEPPGTTEPSPSTATESAPSTDTTPPVETTAPDPDGITAATEAAALVDPSTVPGNPNCAGIEPAGADWIELKVEPVNSGAYGDGTLSVTVTVVNTPQGPTVNWTSNIGVDAVIVKGGPNASVYVYDPESMGDTGLHAPLNPENDTYFGLSHISFCYDVTGPTATTSTTTTTQPTTTTTSTSTSTTTQPTTTTSTTSTSAPPGSTTTTSPPPTTGPPTTPPPPTTAPPPTTPSPFGSAVGPVVLTEDLPRTGSDTGTYVVAGLALLALGAGLTVAARKATSS